MSFPCFHFVSFWESRVRDVLTLFLGFINLIWPHFFGGCNICRPTDEWLLRAGEWEKVDLKPGVGEGKYDTLPHVVGTLTKKG